MATEIKYNGAVIASLSAGQTAVLSCANKKAVSDIVANFDVAGSIIYNETETAVEAGKIATLNCFGKKMLSDVVIVVSADSGGASLPEAGVDSSTGEITDTWEQIQTAISNGVYSTRYAVGNHKTISTDAYGDIKMEIVAFDADTKADGSGTAAISWLSRDLIAQHVMNSTKTNAKGWAASTMRTWLRSEVLAALPAEVQDAIVSVNKTYYDYTTQSTKEIEDSVWLPSYREIFGNNTNDVNCETSGADYTGYFTDAASRIKNYDGSAAIWWLRSALRSGSYTFFSVNSNGSEKTNTATISNGVALGFCT